MIKEIEKQKISSLKILGGNHLSLSLLSLLLQYSRIEASPPRWIFRRTHGLQWMQSCRGCWGGTVYCQGNRIWKHLRGNWKKEQLQELLSCLLLMFVATMWKHLQGWTYSWFPWWCLTRPWLVCQLLLTKRRGRSTVGLSYGKMI